MTATVHWRLGCWRRVRFRAACTAQLVRMNAYNVWSIFFWLLIVLCNELLRKIYLYVWYVMRLNEHHNYFNDQIFLRWCMHGHSLHEILIVKLKRTCAEKMVLLYIIQFLYISEFTLRFYLLSWHRSVWVFEYRSLRAICYSFRLRMRSNKCNAFCKLQALLYFDS
jgi:hypothetical protein